MRLGQRGQATGPTASAITLNLSLIISLVVAIIVVYNVFLTTALPATTTYTDYTLANTSFTDNTLTQPDNWENKIENSIHVTVTNAWNVSGYVTTTLSENTDNIENGTWHQAVTIADLSDGVTTATVAFDYRVIDNDNANSVVLKVLLCDGSDNTTLFSDNVAESASWSDVENNVATNIAAAGTYTVYLISELAADNSNTPNIQVGWDDVNLSIRTYTDYVDADAQAAKDNVETLAWAGIGLMAVAIIIIAAAMILAVVRGFGTGGQV